MLKVGISACIGGQQHMGRYETNIYLFLENRDPIPEHVGRSSSGMGKAFPPGGKLPIAGVSDKSISTKTLSGWVQSGCRTSEQGMTVVTLCALPDLSC